MEGCPGRGRSSLNRRDGRGPGFEGECFTCLRARGDSWRRGNGTAHIGAPGATATLRGRDGSGGSSSRALLRRHGAEGRHPRRGAPQCGAGVVDVRLAAFALRPHEVVASREACDTRSALESDRSKRATVNRHAPFDSSLAARTAGVERETPKHALVVHERAPLAREGSRRGGLRRRCSGTSVLEMR